VTLLASEGLKGNCPRSGDVQKANIQHSENSCHSRNRLMISWSDTSCWGELYLFRWILEGWVPSWSRLDATPPSRRWWCAADSSYAGHPTRSCSFWRTSATPLTMEAGSTISLAKLVLVLLLKHSLRT